MSFSEEQIASLRQRVQEGMSDFRFVHTAEVEKMAVRLGKLYAPEKLSSLRAAALLHDITKEKTPSEHKEILERHGVKLSELDMLSPKTLHARTAELVIKDDYKDYATEEVLCAVRRHTTGSEDMTLFDELIYLADYIDMSRKFSDCIKLREYFFGFDLESATEEEKFIHLHKTLLMSFDMTLCSLAQEGSVISVETVKARNELLRKIKNR